MWIPSPREKYSVKVRKINARKRGLDSNLCSSKISKHFIHTDSERDMDVTENGPQNPGEIGRVLQPNIRCAQPIRSMDLRKKRKMNYHTFNNDLVFNKKASQCKENWPTAKLYDIKILDCRTSASVKEFKTHYLGWDEKYNEWIPANEIFDRSINCDRSDALSLLKLELSVQIIKREPCTFQNKRHRSFD